MRWIAFLLSLLLLAGTVDPARGWLIALVVLTGIATVRPSFSGALRVAFDVRLAAFAVCVLLLAGAIDPTRGWLIVLAAATGFAAFMPRMFHADAPGAHAARAYAGPRDGDVCR